MSLAEFEEWAKEHDRLDAALAAERDRLREALEAVTQQLEHSFTPWPDATIDALRLARAALAPRTPVDVE